MHLSFNFIKWYSSDKNPNYQPQPTNQQPLMAQPFNYQPPQQMVYQGQPQGNYNIPPIQQTTTAYTGVPIPNLYMGASTGSISVR